MIDSNINIIAHIYNDYVCKFGIPRQSGIVNEVESAIIFEQEYRNPDALRGLGNYSYIWLLWKFSENRHCDWSPTVRPPRLGGNTRMGVFATRSPYRPSPIGLSSVKIVRIEQDTIDGPVIIVQGADLMNKTPIYDIKPYIPYADCHADALGGFTDNIQRNELKVVCGHDMLKQLPDNKRAGLLRLLSQDPRPSYHDDSERIYGFEYSEFRIKFTVDNDVLNVIKIVRLD